MPTDPAPDAVTQPETHAASTSANAIASSMGFVVIWAPSDRALLGAWLPVQGEPRVLGRGDAQATDPFPRVRPTRQTPGGNTQLAPFGSAALSRIQLEISPAGDSSLRVRNVGRCKVSRNDESPFDACEVAIGDILQIGNQVLLLCTRRAARIPAGDMPVHEFGEPDQHGIVGESPAIWQLRRELAFVAARPGHVMIHGDSGTGKELAATAVHRSSKRTGPLVSRNAATFPETLIDAELFGNAKGYPNPGMPERHGLIGAANGGTLFLDEFAELPLPQQTRLLRVLDAGEYQRLGESTVRRADVRVVGATNRDLTSLRHDVAARFAFTIRTPDLASRVEDVPLLVRHILRHVTKDDAELRARFFRDDEPNVSAKLMTSLVRAHGSGNVRSLKNTLWRSLAESKGDTLDWPDSVLAAAEHGHENAPSNAPDHDAEKVRRALERNQGSLDKTWRELGLSSRFALNRLMKKHGIAVRRSAS